LPLNITGIPVWIILQPRDFTNSFLLYSGILALFIAAMVAGFKGVTFSAPAMNVAGGTAKLGPIWPFLFITVACGAISGFHCLVAGGTSSKQVSKESDIKKIAFGGMLLEGLLAIGVLVAVGCGIMFQDYMSIVFPTGPGARSNPILAFAARAGGLLDKGLGFPPVCGFNVSYGVQQCIFGHLACLWFRESIACLARINCRVRVAGEQRHQCIVHRSTGDIYDGDYHIFSVCFAY
jgi:carbon starvation protein CstA